MNTLIAITSSSKFSSTFNIECTQFTELLIMINKLKKETKMDLELLWQFISFSVEKPFGNVHKLPWVLQHNRAWEEKDAATKEKIQQRQTQQRKMQHREDASHKSATHTLWSVPLSAGRHLLVACKASLAMHLLVTLPRGSFFHISTAYDCVSMSVSLCHFQISTWYFCASGPLGCHMLVLKALTNSFHTSIAHLLSFASLFRILRLKKEF